MRGVYTIKGRRKTRDIFEVVEEGWRGREGEGGRISWEEEEEKDKNDRNGLNEKGPKRRIKERKRRGIWVIRRKKDEDKD